MSLNFPIIDGVLFGSSSLLIQGGKDLWALVSKIGQLLFIEQNDSHERKCLKGEALWAGVRVLYCPVAIALNILASLGSLFCLVAWDKFYIEPSIPCVHNTLFQWYFQMDYNGDGEGFNNSEQVNYEESLITERHESNDDESINSSLK